MDGDSIPVSVFMDTANGMIPAGTAAYEKRGIAVEIPQWDASKCMQCNWCSYVCPHAVIRPFVLDKAEAELNAYHEEVERIEDLKKKEELFKLEFEQEQKEWAKDGITLKGRYYGTTPQGKKFWIEGNNGFTRRSLHCFTLTIDGETIFTSGEFWRAYGVIKNS